MRGVDEVVWVMWLWLVVVWLWMLWTDVAKVGALSHHRLERFAAPGKGVVVVVHHVPIEPVHIMWLMVVGVTTSTSGDEVRE